MKEFFKKILGKVKGWKTIASLLFVIYALARYYIWKDIDYATLMLLLGIGGTTGVIGFIQHFVEWIESLTKEFHSPDPPQGNR